jgi:hypothetical protein
VKRPKKTRERKLGDLWSVGPSIRRNLVALGVETVEDLARRKPEALYLALCRKERQRQDPCVLDVFRAAVAQARDPGLPEDRCVWWYWSRLRKAGKVGPCPPYEPAASGAPKRRRMARKPSPKRPTREAPMP